MDEKHIKILNWFEKELLLSLNIQSLLAPLRNKKLITSWEEKKLEKLVDVDLTSRTNTAKATFLQILKSKGPNAFGKFLNVLRDENEHSGHQSLHGKLVQHEHGNLPRCESEPADLPGERLVLAAPIRHNSLKKMTLGTSIGRIAEEGVETRLEQICKRLQSLEEKIDSFTATPHDQFSEQNSPYGNVNKGHSIRRSEIAGLPSLQAVFSKASCCQCFISI